MNLASDLTLPYSVPTPTYTPHESESEGSTHSHDPCSADAALEEHREDPTEEGTSPYMGEGSSILPPWVEYTYNDFSQINSQKPLGLRRCELCLFFLYMEQPERMMHKDAWACVGL